MQPKTEINAALSILVAVGDAIRAAGEIPEGELYALLMGRMSLNTFNQIIGALTGAGLVSKSSNLLRWIGPLPEVAK